MEEFMKQSSQKGMYVVDSDNTEALFEEYDEQLQEADELCEIVDPESRPYDSKYKAREILDKICNKLEANRTIASLEKKKNIIDALDYRIAAIRVKTGTISWECEEPHNAQTDLELACNFYIPDLVDHIHTIANDDVNNGQDEVPITVDGIQPPPVPLLTEKFRADAMKCLNILGILWAGRSQVRKSFFYLLAANDFYDKNIIEMANNNKVRRDMENSYTHNLFYLAQAYGHVNDSKKSSYYCHKTLQRQLDFGLNEIKAALDWTKNCAGIADFYLAMKQYNKCALALSSAERVFKERVAQPLRSKAAPNSDAENTATAPLNFVTGNLNAAEIEADLHRRFAFLDVQMLKRGFERENVRKNAAELGMVLSDIDTMELSANDESDFQMPLVSTSSSSSSDDAPETVFGDLTLTAKKTASGIEFFAGLPVQSVPLLSGGEVNSFEVARVVFLRAAARIEAAKKYYVLDGYVTDHCSLVQEHSKLYHYLAGFEADSKRKLAMETRRVDLLLPLVKSLNKVSFEVLHKQISYELGETALAQLEIRLDKLRGPGGEVNEKRLKKTEVAKCNDSCKLGYSMFTHFAFLYAQAKDRTASNCYQHFETLDLCHLTDIACLEPDESLISEDEVRPFLNSHFLACRVLTKIIPTEEYQPPGGNKSHFLVAALRRYEWLSRFIPKICAARGLAVENVFGEELVICKDMVKLLPSKIDRMMYLGESGLSL